MPHPSTDRARQAEGFIFAGDALLEFAAEPITVIAGSPPGRATLSPSPPATRASVAVSERTMHAPLPKVISPLVAFVLGFVPGHLDGVAREYPFGYEHHVWLWTNALRRRARARGIERADPGRTCHRASAWHGGPGERRSGNTSSATSAEKCPPHSLHPCACEASRQQLDSAACSQ